MDRSDGSSTISKIKKMRFRKIKWFSRSHITRKWESWDMIFTFWWSSDSAIVLPKSRVADSRHPGADLALSAKLWCSVWTEFHRTSTSDKATWWPWKIGTKQKANTTVIMSEHRLKLGTFFQTTRMTKYLFILPDKTDCSFFINHKTLASISFLSPK